MQDEPIEAFEDASMEVPNQDIAAFSSSVEVPDDAFMEVTGQDIVSSLPMSSVSKNDNQGGNDSAKLSVLSSEVSEVACMEVTADHDVAALTVDVTDQDVTALSADIPADAFMEATDQDCKIETPVNGDVIPEEIAIPKQESSISVETMKHNKSPSKVLVGDIDEISFSTMTVAPIYEKKANEIQIQSIVASQLKGESYSPAQSEPKDAADEHIQEEDDKNKFYVMKENPLQNMSMRELRKMLKKVTLDGKSNTKSGNVAKVKLNLFYSQLHFLLTAF